MKDWCSFITNLVDDSEKKLIEEVMFSANPAMLKFVRFGSILDQTEIGILSDVSQGSHSHSSIQFERKELTIIKEEEVDFLLLFDLFMGGFNIKVLCSVLKESGESHCSAGSVVIAKRSQDR